MRTMWESGTLAGPLGQWIQLGFRAPVHPGYIQVAFTDSPALGPAVTQVTITSGGGAVTDQVLVTGSPQALRVPPGGTGWLRITVTGVAARPTIGTQVGIREISVPGVDASRVIVAPRVPGADPAAVVLAKAQPRPSSCMLTIQRWVCSPALTTSTEEQYGFDQGFSSPAGYRATLRGSAVLISQGLVAKYLQLIPGQARMSASSRYTRDPQDQPWSAFDGNPATTWIASPTDASPTLSITWQRPRTVHTVTIQRPPGASGQLQVLLAGDSGQARGGTVGRDGVLRFAPMRTSKLTFLFTPVQEPLQISGITIPGVPALATPSGPFRLACGLGPDIELGGKVVPTQVSGTFADLLNARPMRFTACSGVTVARGTNRVVEPARDAFDVQDVVLARSGGPLRARPLSARPLRGGLLSARPLRGGLPSGRSLGNRGKLAAVSAPGTTPTAAAVVRSWTPSRRVLQVTAPARAYLVVNENFNPGWQARLVGTREQGRGQSGGLRRAGAGIAERGRAQSGGGREEHSAGAGMALRPVRIDGWKQAWLLPAGTTGTVTLTYAPNRLYRDAIAGGLGTLALVMLLALWPARRKARERAWRPRWLALPKRSRGDRSREEQSERAKPSQQRELPQPEEHSQRAEPSQRAERSQRAGRLPRWLRRPVRPRPGWGAVLTSAAAVCGLLLAGLWLGGYPGAAILAATACLFTAAFSWRHRHPLWLELSRPWLVAALLLAAAVCAAVGERMLATGASGPLVTVLTSTAPQIICLIVVARLAAALFVGDP
jgi:arabinofuranan 3-O-arabinosyltransferase